MRLYGTGKTGFDHRFGDIVVDSHVIAFIDVVLVVLQGNNDDNHLILTIFFSDVFYHVPSIHTRHHQVEQDDVWCV